MLFYDPIFSWFSLVTSKLTHNQELSISVEAKLARSRDFATNGWRYKARRLEAI